MDGDAALALSVWTAAAPGAVSGAAAGGGVIGGTPSGLPPGDAGTSAVTGSAWAVSLTGVPVSMLGEATASEAAGAGDAPTAGRIAAHVEGPSNLMIMGKQTLTAHTLLRRHRVAVSASAFPDEAFGSISAGDPATDEKPISSARLQPVTCAPDCLCAGAAGEPSSARLPVGMLGLLGLNGPASGWLPTDSGTEATPCRGLEVLSPGGSYSVEERIEL